MTYRRVVNRNHLDGDYDSTEHGLVPGDLRRLERDQRDDHHLTRYAQHAGITKEQAKAVLDAFFEDTLPHLTGPSP
jgi:hypothetical protein